MDKENNNHFAELIPKTPHRTLHILLSILAVVVVIGLITMYQINKVEIVNVEPPVQTELTAGQRDQAVSILKEAASKSPPLTDKQRANAIEQLKKSL